MSGVLPFQTRPPPELRIAHSAVGLSLFADTMLTIPGHCLDLGNIPDGD